MKNTINITPSRYKGKYLYMPAAAMAAIGNQQSIWVYPGKTTEARYAANKSAPQTFICHALFEESWHTQLPLPLRLNDSLECDVTAGAVRILRRVSGKSGTNPESKSSAPVVFTPTSTSGSHPLPTASLKDFRHWESLYPLGYDAAHYDPFIKSASKGDPAALRKVTEWKNVGGTSACPRPMAFDAHPMKEKAFTDFLSKIKTYTSAGGEKILRVDFARRSPVWAIFWVHVLYRKPIFDIHTNRAFQYAITGKLLRGKDAGISTPGHWDLYDGYCGWFNAELKKLQKKDKNLTSRRFDRALLMWGMHHK